MRKILVASVVALIAAASQAAASEGVGVLAPELGHVGYSSGVQDGAEHDGKKRLGAVPWAVMLTLAAGITAIAVVSNHHDHGLSA